MENFSVNVIWSNEDECYIATIPEFSGLFAHGDTREEAIREAEVALEMFIEDMKEDGEEIPKPDTYNSFSGQTRLRLPKSLHRELSQQANLENVSLNTLLVKLLSERHVVRDVKKELDFIENCLISQIKVIDTKESVFSPETPTWSYAGPIQIDEWKKDFAEKK